MWNLCVRSICSVGPAAEGIGQVGAGKPVFRSETSRRRPAFLGTATPSYQSQSVGSTEGSACVRLRTQARPGCADGSATSAGFAPCSFTSAWERKAVVRGTARRVSRAPLGLTNFRRCQFVRVLSPTVGSSVGRSERIAAFPGLRIRWGRALPSTAKPEGGGALGAGDAPPTHPTRRSSGPRSPESPQIAGRSFARAASVSPSASIFECRWQRTQRS